MDTATGSHSHQTRSGVWSARSTLCL